MSHGGPSLCADSWTPLISACPVSPRPLLLTSYTLVKQRSYKTAFLISQSVCSDHQLQYLHSDRFGRLNFPHLIWEVFDNVNNPLSTERSLSAHCSTDPPPPQPTPQVQTHRGPGIRFPWHQSASSSMPLLWTKPPTIIYPILLYLSSPKCLY